MKQQFLTFVIRWVLNAFGLWIAVRILGTGYTDMQLSDNAWLFLLAGLIFSIMNSIVRPFVIILSLPAILLTLGLFTLVINGLMVYLTLLITPGLTMTFWNSILTGIILSLINYIVSSVLELRSTRSRQEVL